MLEPRFSYPIPPRAVAACLILGLVVCVASVHWVHYRNGDRSHPPGSAYRPDGLSATKTLGRPIPVIGTVVDAETEEPIREFRLYEGTHFKSNRPGTWGWHQQTSQSMRPVNAAGTEGDVDAMPGTPDAPGRFLLQLVNLNRWIRYRVQADGYLPQASEPLDAAELPDKPVRLTIRLEKNTGLQHTVFTPPGDRAADAQVATQIKHRDAFPWLTISNGAAEESANAKPASLTRADSSGRFKYPVHNDPFVCLITHDAGYLEITDRELSQREELTLNPWAGIEGTVLVQGEPAPNVRIRLTHFSPRSIAYEPEVPDVYYSLSATTDASGNYRLARGVPGEWNLTLTHELRDEDALQTTDGPKPSPWRSSHLLATLAAGASTLLDIGRDGADVIGQVVVPDGVELDWQFSGVDFRRRLPPGANGIPRTEKHQARLSNDGTFRCFNLRRGEYDGVAIAGTADDPVRSSLLAHRKWGFAKTLRLTPEMFAGKSPTNPIDLGEVVVDRLGPQ